MAGAVSLAALAETRSVLPHVVKRAMELALGTAACFSVDPGFPLEREDLRSVAYIGAWRGCLTYRSGQGCAWETWIIDCCRYEIRQALRDAQRQTEALDRRARAKGRPPLVAVPFSQMGRDDEDLERKAWIGQEDAAFKRLEAQMAGEQMARQALAALTKRERAIAERLLAGECGTSVGASLGVSKGAISQRWRVIREKMKEAVEAEVGG